MVKGRIVGWYGVVGEGSGWWISEGADGGLVRGRMVGWML